MKRLLIKIYSYLTDRCTNCRDKYQYGSFGYGCGFKYCSCNGGTK